MSRILVLTLLTAATLALAGCASKSESYPNKYLLRGAEIPDGLKLAELPEEMPISNPGQVPSMFIEQYIAEYGDALAEAAPDDLWIEFFTNEACGGVDDYENCDGGFMVASGFWNDQQKVDAAVAALLAEGEDEVCGNDDAPGMLLKDGNVLVLVGGGDAEMGDFVDDVASALEQKAPGLTNICA